jgi:FMN phosphatase YigB (HAD superfamily)
MDNQSVDSVGQSALFTNKEESCRVKAILFDLGNVLIDFDHTRAAESIAYFTDLSPEEIFNLFFDSGITGLFEEGKISPVQFFTEVKKMLDLEMDYPQFVPVWNEIFFFSEKNLGVYRLARKLKKTYKFAILSNINVLHFEYIKRTFPLFSAFPIITSCELGARKPHPEIYQKALQILGAAAENVFYTDDRAELVATANKLGIRSSVFKDVDGLRKDLIQAGINIL